MPAKNESWISGLLEKARGIPIWNLIIFLILLGAAMYVTPYSLELGIVIVLTIPFIMRYLMGFSKK